MNKTLVTILLIVLIVLLLVCASVLYNRLSQEPAAGPSAPAGETRLDAEENQSTEELESEPSVVPESMTEEMDEDSGLEPAYDFSFTDSEGNTHRLSDFYGKPILINFWATWCPPCRAELPYLDAAFAKYGDRIQFFLMDLVDGGSETEESTRNFAAENGYSFPLYFDSSSEGMIAYGITAIPYTVAIDSQGNIVAVHLGGMTEEDLQSIMDDLLK